MQLYGYFRSSASYRVRIALALKGLDYDLQPVHLRRGEQQAPDYVARNPQGLVPALVHDEAVLTQSLAIMEYLDERFPEPALLPGTPADRAWVRALAQVVACDIHPINNLRVLQYLEKHLSLGADAQAAWARRWIEDGFAAMEAMLKKSDSRMGEHCFGDAPTLADVCLVPQIFNSQRFAVDMGQYSTLARIHENCMRLPAFKDQAPERQPDAE
ncbi:MAG: maleylacetoacetate isomerase [Deltaproteobacteria bacterium]|nr:maleylacetoacetate isomerase [Deltaproteobacteria bacterium]